MCLVLQQIKMNRLILKFSLLANFEFFFQCAYFKNLNLYSHAPNYQGRYLGKTHKRKKHKYQNMERKSCYLKATLFDIKLTKKKVF